MCLQFKTIVVKDNQEWIVKDWHYQGKRTVIEGVEGAEFQIYAWKRESIVSLSLQNTVTDIGMKEWKLHIYIEKVENVWKHNCFCGRGFSLDQSKLWKKNWLGFYFHMASISCQSQNCGKQILCFDCSGCMD